MRRSRAASFAIIVCLLIPSAYLGWTFRQMPHLRATGDDQIYLVSSKSLAEGHGYRILSLPGQPFQTKYPVLYPFLLSLIWKLAPGFPENLPAFMLVSWLVLPFYIVAAKRMFTAFGFERTEAWLMCALLALNPAVLAASTSVGPDLLFSLLLLVVFLILRRSQECGAWRVLLAGALGGVGYLLRSAAVPLLVTAPLYLLWRGRRARAALFVAGMAPFVLSWSLWSRAHLPDTRDPTTLFYANYIGDFILHFSWHRVPALMLANLRSVLDYAGMSAIFLSVLTPPMVFGILAILGVTLHARRSGLTPFHLFAVAYGTMLVVWPYKPLLRYLLPLAPLMLCGLAHLLFRLAGSMSPKHGRAAGVAFLAVLGCGSAVLAFSTYKAGLDRFRSEFAAERTAYAWIRDHVPQSARFVAAHDGVLYLYTGRQATTYEPLKEFYLGPDEIPAWRERLPGFARERGADYAFCDSRLCAGSLAEEETPLARAVLDRNYHQVYRSGAVTVYRLAD